MTTHTIKALRAKRTEIDEHITVAKKARRNAADDAAKAQYSQRIATLRLERKKVGDTLRATRAQVPAQ